MAISISNTTSGSTNDTTSSGTASVTPSANKLQLLTVVQRTSITADPNQPTATGNGLTWVVEKSIVFDTTTSSRRRLTVFRALGPSPSSGIITIDYGGQANTHASWILNELTGADTSGTNGSGAVVQSVSNKDETGSATTITATLASFASTANATVGAFGGVGTQVTTAGSGFGSLIQVSNGGALDGNTEFRNDNDTTVDITWAAGQSNIGAIGLEIRAEIIRFDAASNSGYQATASSYSWSHVCSTGKNRHLVVGVSLLSVVGSSVTGITYGGVALTFLGAISSVSGAVRTELWGLIAPATGSNSIAVTLSTGLISAAGAISFTGVHQTSPTEGFNSASATNVGAADATVDVTTVATNDWVVDNVATDDGSITVGAGQTSRSNVTGAAGSEASSTEPATTPAAVTMSWTGVGALATWSIGAIALRDVNASTISSSSTILFRRALMGVGI